MANRLVRSRPGQNLDKDARWTQQLNRLAEGHDVGKIATALSLHRYSTDCKYHSDRDETDRTENRRCNCMKYIAGTAPDGTKIRESANTTSRESARKAGNGDLALGDAVQDRQRYACGAGEIAAGGGSGALAGPA